LLKMRRIIKLRFQNGLTFESFKKDVFDIAGLTAEYDFKESPDPDFIIFGPYGIDVPKPGNYVRIGYFCENIKPDLSICDWAFGVIPEEMVNSPIYKRIQWHGLDPKKLIKPADYNASEILSRKKYFCNFLYSHEVKYREEFFRQLSKYKKVDAPGVSMNNMNSIDSRYQGDVWERKRQFLGDYKFTIAFENYIYPGYQTEKIYDAMQADSLPIYAGDPLIGKVFNTSSFVDSAEYLKPRSSLVINWLEKNSLLNFKDILPAYHKEPSSRLRRKLKSLGMELKMRYQFRKLDFSPMIDRIIELDRDDDKYINVLQQPWLLGNRPLSNSSPKDQWRNIFGKPI